MDQENFFKILFQFCEGQIEIRPLPGEQIFFDLDDQVGIDSHCSKHETSNLYFGVGTRDGDGGGKDNLINIPAVWCDCDFKGSSREIIAEKLKAFPFTPSLIVKSGGGIHIYWLLKEPANKTDIKPIEDINHRIADQLRGDHNACDAARVLRVPNTLNRKYDPPKRCEVVSSDGFHYNLDDFLEILPESEHQKKKSKSDIGNNAGWLNELMAGVSEGGRNAAGVKIAGYWINKLPIADVSTILQTWNLNNTPPLDDKELHKIVKSVSRYQPDIETKANANICNVYDAARMVEAYQQHIANLKTNRFILGIPEIDKRIRGAAGGEVLTILARSGSFKTAMLQNLLKNYSQNSAWAAVFFSIEMPVASVTERYFQMFDGCSELIRVSWTDIDNPEGFIRVDSTQKNKKEDRIPINKNSRAILERCEARAKDRATVFRPMTKDFVTHKFKKYIRSAKLPDHIRFHDLRHTYGSYLAMKGHGEKTIQELMRHASIESTLVYTKVSPDHLREVSETVDYGPMPVGKKSRKK